MTKTIYSKDEKKKVVIDPVAGGFMAIVCRFDGQEWQALHNQNRRIFKTIATVDRYANSVLA